MDDQDATSLTTAKTLWTETILEIFYQTLKDKKPDNAVIEVLKEVRQKGFKTEQLIQKVEKKVDKQAALHVRALLQKTG